MPGALDATRIGRRALSVLRDLRDDNCDDPESPMIARATPMTTVTKSRIFHGDRRYAVFPAIRPYTVIFIVASIEKTITKATSRNSCRCADMLACRTSKQGEEQPDKAVRLVLNSYQNAFETAVRVQSGRINGEGDARGKDEQDNRLLKARMPDDVCTCSAHDVVWE
jgi:hypothetical protein